MYRRCFWTCDCQMAGVSVQDIELVFWQDRAMLSDAVSSIKERLPGNVAGLQAFHQINYQSVNTFIQPFIHKFSHSFMIINRDRDGLRCLAEHGRRYWGGATCAIDLQILGVTSPKIYRICNWISRSHIIDSFFSVRSSPPTMCSHSSLDLRESQD